MTTRRYVWATLIVATALAGSVALPANDRLVAWAILAALYLLAVVAVFAVAPPTVSASLKVTDALTERFGAFVIIVLGETVTGVVTGLAAEPTRPITLGVGLAAVLVGFGSWWTYFDFAGHRAPRETWPAVLGWMLAHLPVTAAIAAMGAALVPLVQHAATGRTSAPVAWILAGGALIMLAVIAAQITCLQAWHADRALYRPLSIVCVLACLLPIPIGLVQPNPLLLAATLVLTFAVPWTFAVIRTAQLVR